MPQCKAPRSESWLVYEVLKSWGSHPRVRLWRQNTGAAVLNGQRVRFGVPGQADITGIVNCTYGPGLRIEVEAKSATGKQRPEQAAFQAMIEKFGGLYVLARSVDDVDRALAPLGVTR